MRFDMNSALGSYFVELRVPVLPRFQVHHHHYNDELVRPSGLSSLGLPFRDLDSVADTAKCQSGWRELLRGRINSPAYNVANDHGGDGIG
jgi:hypothetical protein